MKRILKRLSEKADRLASKASEHKNKIVVAGAAALGTVQAQAADLTVPPIETGNFMTVAGVVVVALGVFFGVKKAIGLLR
ncbi:MAG: hypothetical protein PHQ93_03020 [Sulfurimonas sp.]|uniref:hypothetical protein n=1 Tax=Sulfurimonas sp. TaxID=2022749 RepID=UPI002602780B|nr:hypothetical protein [Sulfurimonas sp.]MDD5400143.1 hypothetical protein [Sulfurimonas sp.]